MASKAPTTIKIVSHALLRRAATVYKRRKPDFPRRILIAQKLRLGDAIQITALLAKLRAQYPIAEIVMTARKAYVPLYEKRPYGVDVWPYDSSDSATVSAMLKKDGFDLAIVPGDNGPSWLATALGARWIVAHAGDRPIYKNWPVDEFHSYPLMPTAIGEIFADLSPGPAPSPFELRNWPAPSYQSFAQPISPYVVLHIGASSPLKLWAAEDWRALAAWLTAQGLRVVWSGGNGEAGIVAQIDPEQRFTSYAEQLDLPQLWQLIANAQLLISPDTGVSHLARLTGTPMITLFGPGSRVLFGAGEFWRKRPCVELMIEDFPCRNQRKMFQRPVHWVHHCGRGLDKCPVPHCMLAIDVARVIDAASHLLAVESPATASA